MEYTNLKEATLMVWETNQKKRNINNIISFNLKDNFDANVGDCIKCPIGDNKNSIYTFTEIVENRPSSLTGYNYITAKTEWFIN